MNTSKTILSYEVQAGVFRFIDYQRLLEGEIGYTSNEPVMLCLMSAIETGVIFLINDGIDRGLWDLQNKADRQNDILVKYRHMSVPQNPDVMYKSVRLPRTLLFWCYSSGDTFSRRAANHNPLFFIAYPNTNPGPEMAAPLPVALPSERGTCANKGLLVQKESSSCLACTHIRNATIPVST